jgi:hypothetical protein
VVSGPSVPVAKIADNPDKTPDMNIKQDKNSVLIANWNIDKRARYPIKLFWDKSALLQFLLQLLTMI